MNFILKCVILNISISEGFLKFFKMINFSFTRLKRIQLQGQDLRSYVPVVREPEAGWLCSLPFTDTMLTRYSTPGNRLTKVVCVLDPSTSTVLLAPDKQIKKKKKNLRILYSFFFVCFLSWLYWFHHSVRAPYTQPYTIYVGSCWNRGSEKEWMW